MDWLMYTRYGLRFASLRLLPYLNPSKWPPSLSPLAYTRVRNIEPSWPDQARVSGHRVNPRVAVWALDLEDEKLNPDLLCPMT
jgi:hypothetical protein